MPRRSTAVIESDSSDEEQVPKTVNEPAVVEFVPIPEPDRSPTFKRLQELGDSDESDDEIIVTRHHNSSRKNENHDKSDENVSNPVEKLPAVPKGKSSMSNAVIEIPEGGSDDQRGSEDEGENEAGAENGAIPAEELDGLFGDDDDDAIDNIDGDALNQMAEELLDNNNTANQSAIKKRAAVKRKAMNAKLLLDPENGLNELNKSCKRLKFKGKGHEMDDLRLLMWTMEHWAHRLYPRLKFDDFLDQAERLGKKAEIRQYLRSMRAGDFDQLSTNENATDAGSANDPGVPNDIDELLRIEQEMRQEMASQSNSYANGYPAPQTPSGYTPRPHNSTTNSTSSFDFNASKLVTSTPFPGASKASSVPLPTTPLQYASTPQNANANQHQDSSASEKQPSTLSDEMKARIAAKKQEALAKRAERLRLASLAVTTSS